MSFERNKVTQKVMFRSAREDWATPIGFFQKLDKEFNFTLDACATAINAKVKNFIPPEMDSLAVAWTKDPTWEGKPAVVFCNPPYGRDIGLWLSKGRREAEHGATVVFLIHARTDTKWFHEHVYKVADEIRFVKGRIYFSLDGGKPAPAPFPSMVVVYRRVK